MDKKAGKTTLLMVEDDVALRDLIQGHLSGLGVECLIANHGEEALKVLASHDVDAVLSDISMNGMTGMDLLVQIRMTSMDLPFVILTGYADRDYILEALRLGATDFLEKPIDRETLINVLMRSLDIGVRKKRIRADLNAGNVAQAAADLRMIALLQLANNQQRKKKAG